MMVSCLNHHSKDNHSSSRRITDNLFLEVYQTSQGGVFASDTFSKYLTDSVSFRKYIGYQCDNERIQVSILDSNLVLVCKIDFYTTDTLEMNIYSISQLKKGKKWE
jgi:hypothetical protein